MNSATPGQLVKRRPTVIGRARPADSDSTLCLRTAFNDANILGACKTKKLQGRSIRKITLYYSSYRLSNHFDQPTLNLKRFEALHLLLPEVFSNAVVQWSVVAQQQANSPEEAKELYHGFVVEYLPAPDKACMFSEMRFLDHMTRHDSLGYDSVYYVETSRVKETVRFTGKYYPRSQRKRTAGKLYNKRSIFNREQRKEITCHTKTSKVAVKKFIPSPFAYRYIHHHIPDSTLLAVFNRYRQWDSITLVVDITGSMSPYTSQLLLWFKLNAEKRYVKRFVLFNDGNNKSDNQKPIGRTGGLYAVTHTNPEVVIDETLKAMSKGSGGDAPENNCEALLMAQQQDPRVKEIVMIADNWAGVRDLSLVNRITKPVHVIVCGVYGDSFHTDYLNIARATGGSVHSLTRDIDYLSSISEGSLIKLGETTYVVREGKIIVAD
jgi:hypothetical protein